MGRSSSSEEVLEGGVTTKYNNNNNKQTINNQSVKETNRGQIRGREEEGFGGWEDILDPGKGNQLEEGRTRQYTLEMVERIVYCICCICILL